MEEHKGTCSINTFYVHMYKYQLKLHVHIHIHVCAYMYAHVHVGMYCTRRYKYSTCICTVHNAINYKNAKIM